MTIRETGVSQGHVLEQLQNSITPAALGSLSENGCGAYVAQTLEAFTLRAPGVTGAKVTATAVKANVADVYRPV